MQWYDSPKLAGEVQKRLSEIHGIANTGGSALSWPALKERIEIHFEEGLSDNQKISLPPPLDTQESVDLGSADNFAKFVRGQVKKPEIEKVIACACWLCSDDNVYTFVDFEELKGSADSAQLPKLLSKFFALRMDVAAKVFSEARFVGSYTAVSVQKSLRMTISESDFPRVLPVRLDWSSVNTRYSSNTHETIAQSYLGWMVVDNNDVPIILLKNREEFCNHVLTVLGAANNGQWGEALFDRFLVHEQTELASFTYGSQGSNKKADVSSWMNDNIENIHVFHRDIKYS